jgi:hypothetical protein
MATRAGSKEMEVKELTANPTGSPWDSAQTAATPLGNRAKAERRTRESNATAADLLIVVGVM